MCSQIETFKKEHDELSLVVIDTFQIIRNSGRDISYANDYEEVRILKQLADNLGICILLIYHIRKQDASDPLNKISGTTGIIGAADAVFVLDKSKRNANCATMICTGRDIEYREIELNFSKESCIWELVSDTLENPELLLPDEMAVLIEWGKFKKYFNGSNTEFAESYSSFSGYTMSAKALKQQMNKWRYQLEEQGLYFKSTRSNGHRKIEIFYIEK